MKSPMAGLKNVLAISVRSRFFVRSFLGCFLVHGSLSGGENVAPVTAVFARTSPSYKRGRLEDGKLRPEYYAFGEGGRWNGVMTDPSIDKLQFLDVAKVVAKPLEDQAYLPAKTSDKAKLLIMVYWGTTNGTSGAESSVAAQRLRGATAALPIANQSLAWTRTLESKASSTLSRVPYNTVAGQHGSDWGVYNSNPFPATGAPSTELLEGLLNQQQAQSELSAALSLNAMENRQRDLQDSKNALLLGYDEELAAARRQEFTAFRGVHHDAIDEIEENRYFVVLMAYDFQKMARDHKPVLLWETRFSIRQPGNGFDEQLAAMADYAGHYFGQNSNGLVRNRNLREHIRLDELKILGEAPEGK